MRSIIFVILLSPFAILTGCASQPEGEAATSADERVICRTDRELGSLRQRRVCKTAREWEMERDAQQEGMRSIDRQSQPVDGAGDNIGG